MNISGTLKNPQKNQGECEMWMTLHAIQFFHKVNENITITRHINLTERVPIQKWDIK